MTMRLPRWLIPPIAFQAVVIGGGYATGRELAQFFMSHGPWGGVLGLIVATILFGLLSAFTFVLARNWGTFDYKSYMQRLLGPGWIVFECAYFLLILLVLAVTGAGASAIAVTLGAPSLVGLGVFFTVVVTFVALGSAAVEGLFKYVFPIRMIIYLVFTGLVVAMFGDRVASSFAIFPLEVSGLWGGCLYAGYSAVAAVVVLPMVRHCRSSSEAATGGLLCGLFAMTPATLFFIAMCAFPAQSLAADIPSDVLLQELGSPALRYAYQVLMIGALVETAIGMLHAIGERARPLIAKRARSEGGRRLFRLLLAAALLIGAIVVAGRIGLIDLVAEGYGWMAIVFLLTFALPTAGRFLWERLQGAHSPAAPE